MLRLFFKQKLIGNIGISLISGITALSLAGVAMQMGYSNFKLKAEKQLHILNSIRFATIVQIGMEEGWVDLPLTNDSTTITLSEIDINYQLSTNLKNPSLTSQNYNPDSAIIIENTNGKINFYCTLIEEDSAHNYTDNTINVHNLGVDNISLNI
ncbi:MAG: hypothetical protein VXX85_06810 [Candidatus Margulisiibacteriota bacterium]|nr:hypothetical protein [Candidatus Margulisiibacteriota bacterium]